MTYHFSNKEKEKICNLFENGANFKKIGKIFGCSKCPMRRILIKNLGLKKYKEIAKEHFIENCQQNGRKSRKKWQEEHFEEQKELGRKMGKLPKTEKQLETCRENGRKRVESGAFIRSWEDMFYDLLISQNPHLTIKRQYYLKGLNHAYDIAIPELNLLIEIDGDRWHGHSGNKEMDDKRIQRDAEVDKFAKDNGWKVIRINDKILKKLRII